MTAEMPGVLFDVNALLALVVTTHQHHRAAHRYLASLSGTWSTCPTTESSLVRLLLNPAISGRQTTSAEVLAILDGLRRDARWTLVIDDTSLASPHIDVTVLTGHQQVTDVALVNLAARTSCVLATFDAAIPTWLAPADRKHVVVIPA
ncbi:MAG TPA: hypothetical protein P5181_11295 [Dermatophilaceae bacterium]|nr:hypothetical protein [Dermatophilaceae bacterium]